MTSRRRRKKENAIQDPKTIPEGVVNMPEGAVLADQSQQVPNNSYGPPITYYVGIEFTCCDCKAEETWTAAQQKWYYEVAKGSLYATAIRCRPCRRNIREEQERLHERSHSGSDGNLHSFNSPSRLLNGIRKAIEPSILASGFRFDGRNKQRSQIYLYLDYSRADALLRVCFDMRGSHSRGLTVELLRQSDEEAIVTVASVDVADLALFRPPNDRFVFQRRIDGFVKTVHHFFEALAVATANPLDQ